MRQGFKTNLKTLHFRNIHSLIAIGTASDHYAGWLGQIYSQDRYQGRITKRTKLIASISFGYRKFVGSVISYGQ